MVPGEIGLTGIPGRLRLYGLFSASPIAPERLRSAVREAGMAPRLPSIPGVLQDGVLLHVVQGGVCGNDRVV